MTELVLLGLGMAILLAFSFIGYVVAYRLWVGPIMPAPLRVAVAPTLVPAFTLRPSPTASLQIGTVDPSTAITEAAMRRPPATSPPTRLVISKIGIDIPVVPVGNKNVTEQGVRAVVWDALPDAAGFHQGSAYPGNPGNTVINGHRDIEGAVFRHLDWVTAGDEIAVYVGEVAYRYTVTETMVMPEVLASSEERAESLKVIGHMPDERLTLVTCTPVDLTTQCLVVIARPSDESAE
jgi:sortase A